MACRVDSSTPVTFNCDRGTAMFRPCHRMITSMSLLHASSGARRRASTDSPLRSRVGSDALCLKRELHIFFKIVVPAHGLLFGPIGIHDDLLMDAVLPGWITFRLCHCLRLKQFTDTGEAEQFLYAHHRAFQIELLFIKILLRFGLQVRLLRGEIFRTFQVIEIIADLPGCKQSPDFVGTSAANRGSRSAACRKEKSFSPIR